jgi:5-methylcytosine-specific restriction endonuclease McrA
MGNRGKRKQKKPSPTVQQRLLSENENRCVYCGHEFEQWVSRHGEMQFVALVWDHFLPYSAYGNRQGGFVPACSHCDSIKGDRIFSSIEEASEYICERRQKLGFAD